MRRLPLEVLDSRNTDNHFFQSFLVWCLKQTSKGRRPEKSIFRQFITRLFPWNPLEKGDAEVIDVFIFSHEKDIDVLPYSICGIASAIGNPIQSLNVVGPQRIESLVESLQARIGLNLIFIPDESLLSKHNIELAHEIPSVPKMEILKLLASLESKTRLALILDGDTILLRRRTWVTREGIALVVAQEYHERHNKFNKKHLYLPDDCGLGFVAHHQIVDVDVLEEFIQKFFSIQDLTKVFADSYRDFPQKHDCFPSEWQVVGVLHQMRSERRVHFVNFANLGVSRRSLNWKPDFLHDRLQVEATLEEIRSLCPGLGSLSLHAYK